MGKNAAFKCLLDSVREVARDLWRKGWAERNAGNLSVRLREKEIPSDADLGGDWRAAGVSVPELAGKFLLISGTGSHMRRVAREARDGLGVIEIDERGEAWRSAWGFGAKERPTSELPSHLLAHAARKRVKGDRDRAMIHTHPTNLIALTHALELDTASLTRLLWSMHPECAVVFPEGCGFVPFEVPGGRELAEAGAAALEKRPLAVWEFHGVVGLGPDIDAALGLIDTAEKAAAIYVAASAAGGARRGMSREQLDALARSFDLSLDPEILDGY